MVDTGVLSDRAVAERAGLGFTGRNGFVISPELGTWSYLGEMLVSIPFEPDDPLLDSCGDCTICVDRCPTGALVGNGQLNSQKCISFLTQTKGYLQDEYRYKIEIDYMGVIRVNKFVLKIVVSILSMMILSWNRKF